MCIRSVSIFSQASCSFSRRLTAIKSAHFQPLDLSPGTLAEIRGELERENVAPEIRQKIEQAFGGEPVSPEKRAALEEQLKNENLPKVARDAIQQRLEYGDPPSDARTKLEDAMKDLKPDVRTKVEESLRKAQDKAVIFEVDKEEKPNDLGKWFEARAREKIWRTRHENGAFSSPRL